MCNHWCKVQSLSSEESHPRSILLPSCTGDNPPGVFSLSLVLLFFCSNNTGFMTIITSPADPCPTLTVIISYPVSLLLRWLQCFCLLICLMSGMRSVWWDAGRSCQTCYGCWLQQQQSYSPCWRGLHGIGWDRTPSVDVVCGRTALSRSAESQLQEADRSITQHLVLLMNALISCNSSLNK